MTEGVHVGDFLTVSKEQGSSRPTPASAHLSLFGKTTRGCHTPSRSGII